MSRRRRVFCVAIAMATAAGAVQLGSSPRAAAAETRPWCLPPVFDGGERLHGLPGPFVFWLELLLRQHEVCRRDLPGEVRIFLIGSSSVFGFPYPAEQTFAHQLNRSFAADGVPAHVFNLAFVNPYQVRDAVILNEARRFRPDIILYPVTRSEFVHNAPVFFPAIGAFFDRNREAVDRLAADAPAGIDEPIRKYAAIVHRSGDHSASLEHLREWGRLLRMSARAHARSLAATTGATPRPLANTLHRPRPTYDCEKTRQDVAKNYRDWRTWNIFSYLDALHRRDGVEVLLAYWPLAHQPVEDCYNFRETVSGAAEFAAWMQEEAAARGFGYVDLHAQLEPDLFLDSMHVSAEGHLRVAALLAGALEPMVRQRLEHCRATHTGCGQ